MQQATLDFVRETQPPGHKGVEFSVQKMIELIRKDRTDPAIVAFARRALRDAGLVGSNNQPPVNVARAIWDAMKKQGIEWVPDPVKSEFLAAPRHFAPSELGRDDALMVAGDCDELSMFQAAVGLAALGAVGVETSALCLHSYSADKAIAHVLNAVYDPEARQWIRVDHTYPGGFGDFKTPTHEILISMPSGKTICNGRSCSNATPAPVDDGTPWDHGRLNGLPRQRGGALGIMIPEEQKPHLQSFAEVLDLNSWDLLAAVENFDSARESLEDLFSDLKFTAEERAKYWNPQLDVDAVGLLDSAALTQNALREVQTGQRAWAIDENGGWIFARKEGETQAVTSTGDLVTVLSGLLDEPEPPPALGEALPIPPPLIGVLAIGAVLVTLAGFYALVQSLNALADMARSAEIRAANDTIQDCLKNNDAERCARLGASLAKVRSSREEQDANKAKAEAEKAQAQAKMLGIVASLATVAAGAGAFLYFGGPAVVSSWLASRKKAAA